jgi:ABC-type transporter Mla subunit MlaD
MAEWQNGHPEQTLEERFASAKSLSDQLEALAAQVRTIAQQHQGQGDELLALLRQLEALHREIRDGLFQAALPENRQALYALLRDIEADGGWPYIHRMKLRAFLKKLPIADQEAITPLLDSSLSGGNPHSSCSPAEPESLEW